MKEGNPLYIREGRRFKRLPESGVIIPLAEDDMRRTTEARLAIEGITPFKARHLAFGDGQIPDLDYNALNAVLKVNDFFKATHAWIMGDMMNATTVSKYGYPADYKISLDDEVHETREVLKHISDRLKKANPDIKIRYLEGNHEFRLQKYMDRNAAEIATLSETDGERTVSLPRLLGLKELGIDWVPYWEDEHIGKATILHGNIVRSKGGYTAQAYIDKYGETVISGHTHRLAVVGRTQSGETKWAIETGSLCKRKMAVPYLREGQADWQQGFAVIGVDKDNVLFPSAFPIIDGKTAFGTQVYDGRK